MKRRFSHVLIGILLIAIFTTYPLIVKADMGPKPLITINFENFSEDIIYVAFYSQDNLVSPVKTGDTNQVPVDIQEKFAGYTDSNNFGYCEEIWIVTKEKSRLFYSYMTPNVFKIVVYYPQADKFYESDINNKYAYLASYKADLAKVEYHNIRLDYHIKTFSESFFKDGLVVNMILTLIIELGIAFLFNIRAKKDIGIIILTNIFTQLLLDFRIYQINKTSGGPAVLVAFIVMEIIIFAIEIVIYEIFISDSFTKVKLEDGRENIYEAKTNRVKPVLYALAANFASLFIGLIVSIVFDLLKSIL